MTLFECLDGFLLMGRKKWWPVGKHIDPDQAVIVCVAAVSLSGMLEDALTAADLKAAIHHFASLANGGIISPEQLAAEMLLVDQQLHQWGQDVDAELARIAESN